MTRISWPATFSAVFIVASGAALLLDGEESRAAVFALISIAFALLALRDR